VGAGDGSCDLLWSDAGMQSGPRLLYTSVTLIAVCISRSRSDLNLFSNITHTVYNSVLRNCGKMFPKFKAEQCALGNPKKKQYRALRVNSNAKKWFAQTL
jgi:hypothetical protein